MSSTPVLFDMSKATPVAGPAPTPQTPAQTLSGSVSYATQQDPVKYAKLVDLQARTGIPPIVSEGNEDDIRRNEDANSFDAQGFATVNPRTSGWASNPDNAAVAGIPELHTLGSIEQNAAGMRPVDQMSANPQSAWDKAYDAFNNAFKFLTQDQSKDIKSSLYEFPLTRAIPSVVGGTAGMLGNIGSFFGWDGNGPTRQNILQRIQTNLSPEANTDPSAEFHKSNAVDWLAGNVAPMIPALVASGGTSLLAETLGWSPTAAKVAAGLTVGGMFDLDQAGKTRTAVLSAGGSDKDARSAATKVAAINAIPNSLFGFTDLVPFMRNNPLLTSLGIGGTTGATGQISQNIVTGKPWNQGVPSAALQGAAMQGGLHLGTDAFFGSLAQAIDTTEHSKLRERSPEKFQEALQAVFQGDESLRIPADKFNEYFQGQNVDPAQVASSIGVPNYAEAVLSGGDVEVPKANFFASLDTEHQKGLLPDIIDPTSGLSARQHQEGREELEQWVTNGGADKLIAETAATDAETAATPEFQEVKEKLRQQYIDAGETPEVADTLAEKDANVYANLSRSAGMKPNELMALYAPKVVAGDAPTGDVLNQSRVSSTESPEFKQWFGDSKVTDESGNPKMVYHGTNDNFTKVNFKKGAQGLFWFASDRERIASGEAGAQGAKNIMPLYAKIENPAGWSEYDKYSTDELESRGHDGVILPEKDGSFVGFIFKDAAQVKSAERNRGTFDPNDPNILHQSAPNGPRGWFKLNPDGSYEIGKTNIGDLSTFVHEPAHAYLKIIGDLASRDGASDTLKEDYAKIREFLGAKDGEELTREQQETWARANEQYLREGKAPSASLKGAFQRFALWLGSVYKKASDLGVHLSDDIRGVFDRMYASEEGVNKAESEAGPHLFTSAEEAGWTEQQFKDYADKNNVSVEQAKSHILGLMNEAALRDKTQTWRDEEKNVREAVTAEIDQRPEYAAIRALRKGSLEDGTDMTINRESLVAQFGKDRVSELQKQHPGLYRNEGGIEPETAAELLGFNSAEEMVSKLENTPRRSAAIEQATRAYMTDKHGDIRYDGSLDDQARLALANDQRAETLHREMRALQKKVANLKKGAADDKATSARAAELVAPIQAYREAAQQMVESKSIADLQPNRYLEASRKYSRESFDAMRKGDPWAAAQAKHKELMNHFLFREATKAKEYVGKFEAYAQRAQSKGVQAKLGLAGSDYRDQFNGILARYQLAPYKGQPERTLSDWTMAQYADGKEPAIDPAILNEARTINYRNAPLSEVRMVHDALVNVRKLASLELGMDVNGRKVEFNSALDAMVARAQESIKANPRPILDDNLTKTQKTLDFVNRGSALLMRTEFLMNRLDGGNEGPWHDYLWHLASDAQGKEHELQRDVTARVGAALENMPKEQRMKLLDKVTIEGIGEPVTRRTMIAMAFNMGNEGNMERLQKTFEAHGFYPQAIETVKNSLTREEWKFVQDGWDSLKPLGQAQSDLERRLTGLPPVMVKPEPLHVDHPDGTSSDLAGGYYPVVMDARYSTRAAQQDASSTAQNMMETGYGRATTSRGNMKERTGFGGPLQLDYEQVLTQHTAKVIKDISHREFMLAANKILLHQDIRNTLRDTLGAGNEEQMLPWLRTIINDRNGSTVQGLGLLSRAMNGLRTNVVKAALGFKFSTTLLQLTHASSVFLHTSPSNYAQAMIDFVAHPLEMTEQIKNLSPNEMASRGENLDRDMRKVMQSAVKEKSIGDLWANIGMKPVQFMDHMLSFPLWLSVYRDAQEEHADLPESESNYQAMQKADGAVRMGLGSNAPKDLPPIMRQNDLAKFLTTMGGFHNLKFNQMADVVHQPLGQRDYGKLTYGLVMAAIIPAIMGPLITGRGPKDDENKAAWAAKRALLFPAETMAILNIVVDALENGRDPQFSPIASALARQAKAVKNSRKDNPDWEGIGLDTLQSAMEAFGISGTDQMFKTGRYARKVTQGKVANPNVYDAITGEAKK